MPTLIRPKRGTRNQKNGSDVPRRKSFIAKSTAFTVVPWEPFSQLLDHGPLDAFDNAIHRKVSAVKIVGSDVRKH